MEGPPVYPLRYAIIDLAGHESTCTDSAAVLLADRVRHAGLLVKETLFHAEDRDELKATLDDLARDQELEVLVTFGSDGPAPVDIAIEAAAPLAGKRMEGFEQAVQFLAFEALGFDAWMDRVRCWTLPAPDAVKLLIQLPDDQDLAELVWSELLWPHLSELFDRANPTLDLEERFEGRPEPKQPPLPDESASTE